MVEPGENQKSKRTVQGHNASAQLNLPCEILPEQTAGENDKEYPFKVKYFVKSYRFPKFIRRGTGIKEGNALFEAWASGKSVNGKIPASVFGSSAKWAYNAECLPLGRNGTVLALLWLPDCQSKADF